MLVGPWWIDHWNWDAVVHVIVFQLTRVSYNFGHVTCMFSRLCHACDSCLTLRTILSLYAHCSEDAKQTCYVPGSANVGLHGIGRYLGVVVRASIASWKLIAYVGVSVFSVDQYTAYGCYGDILKLSCPSHAVIEVFLQTQLRVYFVYYITYHMRSLETDMYNVLSRL